jgi:hypothetical protein
VASAATIVVVSYFLDRIGLSFAPMLLLLIAIAAGAVALTWTGLTAAWDRADLAAFAAVVVIAFAWLMWIASPSFLPLGGGPDLTHHLLLIDYVERHWRLVHGPGVEDYLGEMVYYTPGSHVLTALAGAWTRSSGLHALHAVMAAAAALKAGFVYLIAMRTLAPGVPRVPLAMIAVVILFASPTFFLGSFTEFSFLAQIVSELFAMAMWWALAAWDESPRWSLMFLVGLLGSAVFLTWPILVGPPLLLLAALMLLPRAMAFRLRLAHATVALLPVVVTAAAFITALLFAGRIGMMMIAGTGGGAVTPTVSAYGPYGAWLLAASAVGFVFSSIRREARTTIVLGAAIAVQGAVLYWFARRHANPPYMALKLLYFFLYPQAVAAAIGIASVWRGIAAVATAPRVQTVGARAVRLESSLAWALAFGIALVVVRPLAGAPGSLSPGRKAATSLPLERAGQWARANLPAACVEYLVGNPDTAYWLHLAVLGHARMGARTADNATYELSPALVRWLTPGGLPYAIVDLPAIPSGVRSELDILVQFDTAAVAKRRGPGKCAEGS